MAEAVDLHRLLLPGLSPTEVAEQYFKACTERDTKLFLATIHLELRGQANTSGPFSMCNWELGRTRFEKYKVNYKLVREANRSDQSVSLHYTPLYGPVPGFVEGEALGPVVILNLKKAAGEWKVASGEF